MEDKNLGIAFGSINTGLPRDIVQQIMKSERIPIKNMELKKEKFNDKKTLINELTQLTQEVRDHLIKHGNAKGLREFKVSTRNDIIDVIIDKEKVEPGSYQFQVNRLAQKSSAFTSGFESPDDIYVGVGLIRYSLPNGDSYETYIDSGNASLKDIAKLISKDKNNNLHATVINDGSGSKTPWRILLTFEETGEDHKVSFPYFYFIDGEEDLSIEFERKAHNALVHLDGFEIEFQKNEINESKFIPGININLKKAIPEEEFSIKIDEDIEKISSKIENLVNKINAVLSFILEQNNIDANSDTSRTLGGDIILQTIERRIRSTIFKDIPTRFGLKKANDLGITFQRSGLLDYDKKKFEAIAAKDYRIVEDTLIGFFDKNGKTNGLMNNLFNSIEFALRMPNGILPVRRKGLESNINDVDRRIDQKERMLEEKEATLKKKFAKLEGTISRLKSSSAGLATLGNNLGATLPKAGGP